MARFISDNQIEEIRVRNDIVDVVGSVVPLKRAGANFKALCPFHNEKTPSFHVNPSMQIFHCFGCGVGGDVFKFVMLYENLSFPEAARWLAERAGIVIEAPDPAQRRKREVRDWMLELHEEAAQWFARQLASPDGAPAREYLESREFPAEWAEAWRLGYAPSGWDGFLSWAVRRKWSPEQLVQAGLAMPPSGGGGRPYDRFRGRLIFPIADERGRVVGFSGRVLDPEAKEAKYINSPETPIFVKGRLLFGLHRARRAILEKRRVVVCEGQIDVIRAQMSGMPETVAPLGTAFTPDHARLLRRYADEAVLLFDADRAGQEAAVRSFETLLSARISTRIARLPAGEDPDSLLRRDGVDALRRIVDDAVEMIDFRIDLLLKDHSLAQAAGRMRIADEIVALLSRIEDPILRDDYLVRAADRTGLRRDALESRLSRSPGRRAPAAADDAPASKAAGIQAGRDPEWILLGLLLREPESAADLAEEIPEESLSEEPAGRLLRRILRLLREDRWEGHLSLLAEVETDPDAQKTITAVLMDPIRAGDPRRLLQDCLDALELRRIRTEIEALKRRLVELSAAGGGAGELRETQERLQERIRRERSLRPLERNLRGCVP